MPLDPDAPPDLVVVSTVFGVPGLIEVQTPLGLELAVGVAPLGEVEHQGLQLGSRFEALASCIERRHSVGGAQGFAVFGQSHLGQAHLRPGLQLLEGQ
jgi:hypothetical protein